MARICRRWRMSMCTAKASLGNSHALQSSRLRRGAVMIAIPDDVQQISPDWLRASVQPPDVAAFSNLASIRAERIGEGVGMATDLHRLHLGYTTGATSCPATLVAKMPSKVPEVLQIA